MWWLESAPSLTKHFCARREIASGWVVSSSSLTFPTLCPVGHKYQGPLCELSLENTLTLLLSWSCGAACGPLRGRTGQEGLKSSSWG